MSFTAMEKNKEEVVARVDRRRQRALFYAAPRKSSCSLKRVYERELTSYELLRFGRGREDSSASEPVCTSVVNICAKQMANVLCASHHAHLGFQRHRKIVPGTKDLLRYPAYTVGSSADGEATDSRDTRAIGADRSSI